MMPFLPLKQTNKQKEKATLPHCLFIEAVAHLCKLSWIYSVQQLSPSSTSWVPLVSQVFQVCRKDWPVKEQGGVWAGNLTEYLNSVVCKGILVTFLAWKGNLAIPCIPHLTQALWSGKPLDSSPGKWGRWGTVSSCQRGVDFHEFGRSFPAGTCLAVLHPPNLGKAQVEKNSWRSPASAQSWACPEASQAELGWSLGASVPSITESLGEGDFNFSCTHFTLLLCPLFCQSSLLCPSLFVL